MDTPEKSPGAVGRDMSPRPPASMTATPRRMLHRVETAALDLPIGLRLGPEVTRGHLLNISGGGCSVRVPLPLTLALDTGMAFDVILPAGESELTCPGELVGLTIGKGSASLRLRFRVLTPEKRRALLSLVGELVTRDFQLRHTGGNRAWRTTNRP
jgi:c-di-GMP-binding flagellar brake protein YcgR